MKCPNCNTQIVREHVKVQVNSLPVGFQLAISVRCPVCFLKWMTTRHVSVNFSKGLTFSGEPKGGE